MFSSSTDLPQKSFQMKEDTKFLPRLVSKESSMTNPSFRVYYGGVSGAVPFMWETQPGTPKHKFSDTSIPPLTPPPSYYFNNNNINKPTKKHSRSKLLNTLFLRINLKKFNVPSSPSSSTLSSSSSSSSSSWSSSRTGSKVHGRSRFLSPRSSFDDEEMADFGSPTSTLCFGIGRENTSTGGGYSVVVMKKTLLSMVGRRSA